MHRLGLLLVLAGACNDSRLVASGDHPDGGTDAAVVVDAAVDATIAPDAPDAGVMITGSSFCSSAWCWTYPTPMGNSIKGMWGTASSDIWAVGTGGTVMHWNGAAWSQFGITTDDLEDVFGFAANDVWAVGKAGHTLHWDGATWTDVPNPSNGNWLRNVWGASGTDIWTSGMNLMMHWDGTSWTATSLGSTPTNFYAIWGASSSNAWVASSWGMWHYDGTSWSVFSPSGSATGWSMWGTGADNIWLTGYGVWHFDGSNWNAVTSFPWPSYYYLDRVSGHAANDVWISGQEGEVFHYDGTSWTGGVTLATSDHPAIWPAGGNDVWIAGDGGDFNHWDGSAWNIGGARTNLTAMWGASDDDAWAVGGVGLAFHWDGHAWTQFGTGAIVSSWLEAIWGTSSSDIWAVGLDGLAMHWDGTAWTGVSTGAWCNGVWGSAVTNYWAACGAVVLHYDGTSWSQAASFADGTELNLNAMYGTSSSDVWTVGDRGTIAHYDGATWTLLSQSSSFGSLTGVWGSSPTDVWALSSSSGAYHYDGTTWMHVSAPGGSKIWGRAGNDVWSVGAAGTAAHYDGTTWTLTPTDTANDINAVYGTPTKMWVVGASSSILQGR